MKSNLIYRSDSIPQKPLLSFIIPTYKNLSYLSTAIGGILSQNTKEFVDYEIIVICNDPQGDLSEFAKKFEKERISFYVNEENYGQVGNLNQGISLANGEYISIIHDDDMILPNYFEEILPRIINPQKEYDCILPASYLQYGTYKFDFKHKFLSFCYAYRFLYRKALTSVPKDAWIRTFDDVYGPPSCGVVFKKEKLIEFGLFKDERAAAWDYYNFREFHKTNDIYFLHKYLGVRRCETGMSLNPRVQKEFREDREMIVKADAASHPVIKKYNQTLLTHRPKLRYIIFRFASKTYHYTHNLDVRKCVPKIKFKKIKLYEEELNK